MGKDWPNWRCQHANDMEELEYAFESASGEHMLHYWRRDVDKTKQDHQDQCVKRGYKPNPDWHRKAWLRKDWYHWDCEHAAYMKHMYRQYIWLKDHESSSWKEEVLRISKDHEDEFARK